MKYGTLEARARSSTGQSVSLRTRRFEGSNPSGRTKYDIIKYMKKIFPILTILFLIFSAVPLTADAGIVQCGAAQDDPKTIGVIESKSCEFCDIFKLVIDTYNFLVFPTSTNNGFAVVPIIATLLILIGGFYILIAAGRPELQKTGRNIITAVVIGLLIVYIAWVAVNSILTFFGVEEWTGLNEWWSIWWSIKCN